MMVMRWRGQMGLTAGMALSTAAAAAEGMARWTALLATVAMAVIADHSAESVEPAAWALTLPGQNLVLARRVETVATAGMASSAAAPEQTLAKALVPAKMPPGRVARAAEAEMLGVVVGRVGMVVSADAAEMAVTERTPEVSVVLAGMAGMRQGVEQPATVVSAVMAETAVATTPEQLMTELVAPAVKAAMAETR